MKKLWYALQGFLSTDIGIDLGTANSVVFVRGKGIVTSEPSVVAIHRKTGKVVAVGMEAKKMIGRTPGDLEAIRPMKEGVIANFEITKEMLRYFIQKVHRHRLMGPRVLVAVPSGITEVESRAVKDSAFAAGARAVKLIEEPMASAMGVGLPVSDPVGNMIVDIGGGTTEVAVISLSGVVDCRSVRTGGDSMDNAIIRMIKRSYSLSIGERTAEEIKITIGSAYKLPNELQMAVRGRDLNAGLPKTITISSMEVREALLEPINAIVDAVRITLERCPPELSSDLIDHGIMLAGGGALLRGIDQLLSEETGLPTSVAEEPLLAVAKGTGVALEHFDLIDGD